eukprot:2414839-Ditylum_brightwellii.AAC.1
MFCQSKRRHCRSNKNHQNYCNCQINNNYQNPNFNPAFKQFKKGVGESSENIKSGENTKINKAARKSTAPWAVCKKKATMTYQGGHHLGGEIC